MKAPTLFVAQYYVIKISHQRLLHVVLLHVLLNEGDTQIMEITHLLLGVFYTSVSLSESH